MKEIGRLSVCMVIFLVIFSTSALAIEARMTVTDREMLERLHSLDLRVARLEEGQKTIRSEMKEGQKAIRTEMNAGQKGLQRQIDGLRSLIIGGFGVVFAGIFSLIGFVIWDRRTAISPVISKTKELEQKDDLTIKILKEYAKKEPKLAEVLRSLGLL